MSLSVKMGVLQKRMYKLLCSNDFKILKVYGTLLTCSYGGMLTIAKFY